MANQNSMQELDGEQNNSLLSSSTFAFSQVASLHFKNSSCNFINQNQCAVPENIDTTPTEVIRALQRELYDANWNGECFGENVPSIGSKVKAVSGTKQSDSCKHKTSKVVKT